MAEKPQGEHGQVVVTDGTIVLSLSPENQKNLKKCVEKGKLKITMDEIPMSKLPHIKANGGGTTID